MDLKITRLTEIAFLILTSGSWLQVWHIKINAYVDVMFVVQNKTSNCYTNIYLFSCNLTTKDVIHMLVHSITLNVIFNPIFYFNHRELMFGGERGLGCMT